MEPVLVVEDEDSAARIIAERQELGIDRYDEVHDGVYVVAPAPVGDHQLLVMRIGAALHGFGGGKSSAGINIGTTDDYRIPDVALLAEDTPSALWYTDGVLVAVEILSPREQPSVKIDHYRAHGVGAYVEVDPSVSSVTVVDLGSDLDLDELRERVQAALE